MPSPSTVLLYVLLLCMELTAAFVLLVGLSLFDLSTLGYGTFWPALLTGIVGLLTALFLAAWSSPSTLARATPVVVGAGVVGTTALLTSNDAVSRLVGGLYFALAFWRGMAVTGEPPGHSEVERRFGFGFAFFFVGIVGIVARGMVQDRWIWQLIAIAGLGYVAVSLVALGTARLEHQREPGALRAVILAIAVQVGVLVILGLAALQIFALDMFGWLGHSIQPLSDAIGATLFNAVIPFAGVIDHLFSLIKPHAHSEGVHVAPYRPGDNTRTKKLKEHAKQHVNGTPYAIGALVVILIALAFVGYLVWRAHPRKFGTDRAALPYGERREASMSPSEIWSAFIAFLRSIFRGSVAATAGGVIALRRRVWGPPYPSDPVRRAYAQLLRRSAEAGALRAPAATPTEFEKVLESRWAAGTPDFEALTTAYIARRYGDRTFAPEDVNRVRASWHRARRLIRVPEEDEVGGNSGVLTAEPEDHAGDDWLGVVRRSRS